MDTQLNHLLASSLDGYIRFFARLLQVPNERMQEHESVRMVGQALETAGCVVEFFEGEGLGEPTPAGPPLNCIAHRPGSGAGRSLLLEAHIDTVSPGDRTRWTESPWSGTIRDGRLYGRGAHDDRVGAAMLWMVTDLLRQLHVTTAGDLDLLVTTEEEFSGGGMKAYLKRPDRIRPDAHLLVDGNGPHDCITGHPGVLNFTIRIEGPFGSVQQPGAGHDANPIELMGLVVQTLRAFETQVRQTLHNLGVDPRWPPAIVAVTDIQSTGWFSNVPEACIAGGFCNVPPPMTLEQYKVLFTEFLRSSTNSIPWLSHHPPDIQWGPLEVPALVTSESSDFYCLLAQTHEQSFGVPLTARWIGGWGDMALLGCPNAMFYGPGGGGGDHGYDEYYELQDLAPTLKTLVRLVLEWCGQS